MRLIKLQRSPRHRQRIRDVAKDLGVTSRQLLDELKELDEYASSAASYIEASVIRAVHDRHGVAYVVPTTPDPAAKTTSSPIATGLGPPLPRERRENHPLMNEESRPRDRAAVDASLSDRFSDQARRANPVFRTERRTAVGSGEFG